MTTIYIIRHSKPLKVNNDTNKDSLQVQNEKSSLSIEGERIARGVSRIKEAILGSTFMGDWLLL